MGIEKQTRPALWSLAAAKWLSTTLLLLILLSTSACGPSDADVNAALASLDQNGMDIDSIHTLTSLQKGDDFAYPVLVRWIEADSTTATPFAINTLARIAPSSVSVPPLIAALDSDNSDIVGTAANNLGEIGSDAKPAIDKLIQRRYELREKMDENSRVAVTFMEDAIRKIDPARELPRQYKGSISGRWMSLSQALDLINSEWDTTPAVFAADDACQIVRNHGSADQIRQSIAVLAEQVLRHGSEPQRLFAASALGDFGSHAEPALAALEYARDYDKSREVREVASEAIGAINYGIRNDSD